jgi:formylglycine-generating enzyme required for sulfatase activity
MTPFPPAPRAVLAALLLAVALDASAAADRREKIAVMKVDAPDLSRSEVASLRNLLEVGVTQAVGSRLQVMTRDSAAAMIGGGDKLVACMEGASCDAEIGGALGVDYFVSASVLKTPRGLELGVTVLRIGREASLLKKDVKVYPSVRELLDSTSAHAEIVTRAALGGLLGRGAPRAAAGVLEESGVDIPTGDDEEVVVAFESAPDGATVLLDGAVLCRETPCRKRVPAGAHEASFQRERYAPAVQRFTAARGATVKATLAPRFGWITVETTPPGLAVAVDGVDAGRAPLASHELDEGSREIAVVDRCWLRTGERIAVKAGERRTVRLAAKPRLAGLRVDAEDARGNAVEADVKVDGSVAGPVGATLKVPVCAKTVSVSLGKETFEAALTLEEGKVARVRATPAKRAASASPAASAAPVRTAATASPGVVATVAMARLPGGLLDTIRIAGTKHGRVRVEAFQLDVTEVTVGAYEACVSAGRCQPPGTGGECDWGKPGRQSRPVNCVEWSQANAYCDFVGKRLPTEDEWEWAAGGADRKTTYPWGNERPANRVCWDGPGNERKARGFYTTCDVGAFPAGDSPQGVKDLAGNVWEWTDGAGERGERFAHGGGWDYFVPSVVSATSRQVLPAGSRIGANYGFRCARDR